jgi:membrane protein GlpM
VLLILKALLGALIVVIVDLLAKTKNFYIAGLVIFFPTFSLITHYIIGSSRGSSDLRETIVFGCLSIIPYLAYVGAVYWFAPRMPILLTLVSGLIAWSVVAVILVLSWNRQGG